MTGDGPPQLHFDPESGAVPDEVGPGALPQGAGGGVVTLFLAADADREWAGRSAIELARTWGDSGQRVFLGDLCFRSPILHDLLDESASPNLADVILRQVRIEDVVRSVVAGSFLFAPACSADADAPPVVGDVRWEGLIEGFAEVGATAFLFADETVPGIGQILEASSTVFVFGGSGALDLSPEVATRVGAVLRPPPNGPAKGATDPHVDERVSAETFPERVAPRSDGLEEFVVDEPSLEGPSLVGITPEDPLEPPPPGEEASPREWEDHREDDVGDPVTSGADKVGESGSAPAAWARRSLTGLIVIVFGLLTIWIAWPAAEESAPNVSSEPPVAPSVPAGTAPALADSNDDPALGYSLTLASYRDPGAALRRAAALGRLRPRVAFIVATVRVDGTTYHRLLAVAAGADEARALRDSIGSVTAGDDSSAWIVRRTPLAFELAAVSDVEEARMLVGRAESQGIYAYIVVQSGADRPIYAVLAGAYQGEDEAVAMGDLLANAGFADASLKSRVGRIVQ
jgi:SPOR domain